MNKFDFCWKFMGESIVTTNIYIEQDILLANEVEHVIEKTILLKLSSKLILGWLLGAWMKELQALLDHKENPGLKTSWA